MPNIDEVKVILAEIKHELQLDIEIVSDLVSFILNNVRLLKNDEMIIFKPSYLGKMRGRWVECHLLCVEKLQQRGYSVQVDYSHNIPALIIL